MAVVKTEKTAKLLLSVQVDTNTKGDPVYRQRSFPDLNPAISDEDLLTFGQSLGALQTYNVDCVARQDQAILESE